MAVASLLLGFVLTVVGVALVSVPAALVVAGVALIAAGVDMTRPASPTADDVRRLEVAE